GDIGEASGCGHIAHLHPAGAATHHAGRQNMQRPMRLAPRRGHRVEHGLMPSRGMLEAIIGADAIDDDTGLIDQCRLKPRRTPIDDHPHFCLLQFVDSLKHFKLWSTITYTRSILWTI